MRRALIALAALLTALTCTGLVGIAPTAADEPPFHKLTFPVQEKVSYSDDWGAARAGGRSHQGNDLMGQKLYREVAAADGVIEWVKVADGTNTAGNMLSLKGTDGWTYWYIHINNDTPGTDDGANPPEYRFAPGIAPGVKVKAGQFIAYMGDSGDAETTGPHLHFELHQPDGTPVDPWTSLRLAQGLPAGNRCAFPSNPDPSPNAASGSGYWVLGQDGGVFSFGAAAFYGSTGDIHLNQPIVGMAATSAGKGYWLVATDGGIFAFGDAAFHGSTGAIHLNQPIVGMATTPSGKGYWLVATDGGIFAFGDAAFYGSTGAIHLNQPIVGMATTPSGKGYWLVARDGGIFSFGDASFTGSTGDIRLNQPIVGMAPSAGGTGYWLLAGDGGIFAFGTAGYNGSILGNGLCKNPAARRIVASSTGKGYWIVSDDGSTSAFGDARWLGAPNALGLARIPAIVGMAVAR